MRPDTVADKGTYRGVVPAMTVRQIGRFTSYSRRSETGYASFMGAEVDGKPWGRYVKGITDRTGWSVARLNRDSGISTSTLWEYIGGKSKKAVTIPTVMAIATAAGDDPIIAFRAAAGLSDEAPEDEEISLVLAEPDISARSKDEIIESIMKRRARNREIERQRGMDETQDLIRIARSQVA